MSPLKENFNFKKVKKLKSQSENESAKKNKALGIEKREKSTFISFRKIQLLRKDMYQGSGNYYKLYKVMEFLFLIWS